MNCVSPDLVYRRWQRSIHGRPDAGGTVVAGRPGVPVVTVLDGHPSALAWVGSMLGVRARPLGVTRYGESGTRDQLYREFQIDARAIAATCRAALARPPE